MAEQQNISERRVLHVAPLAHALAERMAEALRAADCDVVPCPDVYRALAWMGGRESGRLRAVVVCVDLLSAGQFEFFQLAARLHRRLPVYVHAQPHARKSIDSALRCGAADTIDADSIERVLPIRSPVAAAPVEREPPKQPPAPAPAVIESDQAPPPSKEKPTGRARVPWLHYEGGPKRIPPQRARTRIEPTELAADEQEPPLLSPEELKALMGDDDADDSTNGRGKRGNRQ